MSRKPVKVLLVEDNPGDAFLIRQIFNQVETTHFQLTDVEFLEEAVQALRTVDFDLVLLDLSLPDSRGLETLLVIEKQCSSLPIVILTGLDDEEIAIQAVRQGAQDYLVKGQFNQDLLIRSIHYAIERKQLQENLKQRTVELEAANQELKSFSYTVSHDLKNPLQNIQGFSYLLKVKYENKLDDQGKHFLEHIQENTIRMKHLIEDLLQLSDVQHYQLKCFVVDLSATAKDIISRLQHQQPERKLKFTMNPNILAQGDPHLLQIALDNLLENAWKYTGKQEITKIQFGVCAWDSFPPQSRIRQPPIPFPQTVDENNRVYFIQDNGIGFDLDEAEQLFTPFKRLHSSKEFKGTGIGLATVERIIKRHRGKIWAKSAVNQGTTFYFTLNCQEAQESSDLSIKPSK